MHSLKKDQILMILGAARAVCERDWLMILTAYHHGLRASEVIGLKADNIEAGFLIVQRLKGSEKTRQALVTDDNPLLDEYQALIDCAGKSIFNQRLFPITRQRFWQIVREHGARAGLPKSLCHPHTLKHSTAMQMLPTATIPDIQKRMGHKSGSSTLVYMKRTDAEADAAYQKAQRVSQD